jgi:alcohol dehydrogenase (cytochrome c)
MIVSKPTRLGWLRRRAAAAAVAAGCAVAVASVSPVASGAATSSPSTWELPNLSRASTREAPASPITAANVGRLHVLWRFRFTGSAVSYPGGSPEAIRAVVATPVVAGNAVYIQDSMSNVFALDRATGAPLWEHRFRAPNFGRNGLAYSSGSVYGATDTTAFALSAATGRLIWQRRLVSTVAEYVDIAPLVANDLVYISTVGYPPGGRGALYALDAHSGAIRWRFATIRKGWRNPVLAGGGGAWYTPSVDAAGNVYWGIANPYPAGGSPREPNGAAYAGTALYTDSLLVLDGKTGRLRWYDQVTPHDVRDHDFQLPPILSPAGVVFGAGKAGHVVAWNARTHTRIWQTSVGRHLNAAGPLPTRTVPICPGLYGGVLTPMAYDGTRVFVPVIDLCSPGSAVGYASVHTVNPLDGSGELVALDADTGRVAWKRELPQPDFGCATVANGVVFTSTFDGRVYGFDAATGATLWEAQAPAGINACPALSGGLLLVPAGSGTTRRPRPRYELVAYALPR